MSNHALFVEGVSGVAGKIKIMKATIQILSTVLAFFLSLTPLSAQRNVSIAKMDALDRAADLAVMLEALATVEPVKFDTLPKNRRGQVIVMGGFVSMQHPEWPPLPGNFYNLDVWPLGEGHFVLDDRQVDYAALEREARLAEAADLEAAPQLRMMSSSLNSYAYGNPVYLTNLVVTAGLTAAFDIAGGTNNVPYDIQMTTNLLSAWNWLGIGYTSNRYTFTSQPSDIAFYRLAKPSQTMIAGFGDDSAAQCAVPNGLTNILQVAAGGAHTLALKSDGKVLAWGWNGYGQTTVPSGLSNVTMIAAGYYHSVALLTNGSVVAWGLNLPFIGYALTQVPPSLTNAIVIAALATHTLALRQDGTVVVWGYDGGSGVTNVPVGLSNVVAIAAGANHNLAVSNGLVIAWGANNYGQCNVPTGLSNVVDVAAGAYHSLALKQDGTVVAWGGNAAGETNIPAGLSNVVAIAAGGDTSYSIYTAYSLALKKDGTVVTWGDNEATDPVGGLNNVIGISAGADHALAIRTGPATPVITLEPFDQFQVAGSNVTFTARGAGLYGVTYQWQTNTVNLPGATNAALTVTNVQAPQVAASYRVMVANEVGSLASSNANLHFVTPPEIISFTLPTNPIVAYQSNLTLNVVATAPGMFNGFPLSYQWLFNGSNLAGATGSSYIIHGNASAFGTYFVRVSNAAGSTNAAWYALVLNTNGLLVTQHPTNRYQIAGGSLNFTAEGVGLNLISYQWQFNGTNLAGATNSVLTLTNVQSIDAGNYRAVISDGVSSLASSNATFTLVTKPVITTQSAPTNQVKIYGNYVALNGAATAPGLTNGFPLTYRWKLNGTNLAGATTTNYSFIVSDTNGGTYSLVVTNAAGSTNISWQVTITNAINVTNDLLLIYNTNSQDSTTCLNYYLAHRPNVGGANVLGIGYTNPASPNYFETVTPSNLTSQIFNPILNWLTNNPTKRPQYVILFMDLPSRVNSSSTFGSNDVVYPSVCIQMQSLASNWQPYITHLNMGMTNTVNRTNDFIAYINKLVSIGVAVSSNSPVLSASIGGYANTNFVLDGVRNAIIGNGSFLVERVGTC